jgi:putative hydrolase of the HAD superfamily
MIKLLTFDLDNTLWDVNRIMPRANQAMRDWIRQEHAEFAAQFDLRGMARLLGEVAKNHPEIAHDFTQLRLEVLRRAFLEGGYSDVHAKTAAEGAFLAFYQERNRVDFFPQVLDALARLKKHYQMVSISNGNADIHRVGLTPYFSQQFSAISVGVPKPDPRIFEAALQATGCEPHQVVHIGDDPVLDVEAAAKVGMKTVWVNYEQQPWPTTLPPSDIVITRFDELPAQLAAFNV